MKTKEQMMKEAVFFTKGNVQCIDAADLPSDIPGKTIREVNAEKKHRIPIGTLVEITKWDNDHNGVRMFVVKHSRDCDQTPLYCLSPDRSNIEQEREGFINRNWYSGISEKGLKIIKE